MAHQSLLSVSVVHFRHYADFTLHRQYHQKSQSLGIALEVRI